MAVLAGCTSPQLGLYKMNQETYRASLEKCDRAYKESSSFDVTTCIQRARTFLREADEAVNTPINAPVTVIQYR